jgi:UTP:GlnB (protein PII) uridylyltransferase
VTRASICSRSTLSPKGGTRRWIWCPRTQRKRAFLLESEDRVGVLAELTRKLADAGINITALDAVTAGAGRFGALFWVPPDDYNRAAEVLEAR